MTLSISRATGALLLITGLGLAHAADPTVTLTGAQEVPAVTTGATGNAMITVATDKSVVGKVTTTGIAGTAAHIHSGAAGENGPVAIPLVPGSNGEWMVPAGSKLTDEQFAAYKAGKLYVNVHSDGHKPGEIRTQLKP